MRYITSKELTWIEEYLRSKGEHGEADKYNYEERKLQEKLQDEMNRD